jgi:hypothetical protein
MAVGSTTVTRPRGYVHRVFVVDGRYHQPWGNTTVSRRNGAGRIVSVTVGRRMRCGIEQPLGVNWAAEGMTEDRAIEIATPCVGCFA